MTDSFLTVGEVAKILRISPGTVYKFLRENKLPQAVVGKKKLIPRRCIENLIQKPQAAGEGESPCT
jgi:excisionase family DNA binding protein